ncbi:MAG: TIGR00282 family metallophosphoesterase [Candidatus Liberibacter europaeus]|uniref:TIGR00282 family metallophosphoesterase n=1 Tax=Candidatus Liberibacter europaeus TaxID=744859 RepID=A0A2T4VYR8_9HYPH|nr:TIGR00282 family metallophosphoesterase [Candidatus Liberibacter europaeus]PTL86906.1 MAG: TIGR00282 family metallophosphoesterase [Candidatus Liberibacter europaeus]
MRLLFLGDIMGKSGRSIVYKTLPNLIKDFKIDFVIANGENSAGGFGITEKIFLEMIEVGIDVVTTGNHVWNKKEALMFSQRHHRFLRPANYPPETPGNGSGIYHAKNGSQVLVTNVMGRIFMNPILDDPFRISAKILESCPLKEHADVIVFDFHAETTSEKQCFAHFVDSRASIVVGTHTHIPTADARILDGGTGYISDVGMCGDYNSSIGIDKEEPINRFVTHIPKNSFNVAEGPATLCGVCAEISDVTGLTEKIEPIRIGPYLEENIPHFWR